MKLDTIERMYFHITRVIQIQVWFVVLLLCDENMFYINLMHPQNMSRSKPKKSLVTIQRGHFMKSVFVNPGIYSCAVDAFLEVSTHLHSH